ncbi:MAG: hypothetical protein ACOYI5_06075 [Christensenellales bacterium]|jgi:hypothetical protein
MEVRREMAGRELRLKYTFNSICAVEERAGMPLDRFMTKVYNPVRLLFWGALIELQPEMTLTAAGEIIGAHIKAGGALDDVAELCAEALEAAGFFHRDDE